VLSYFSELSHSATATQTFATVLSNFGTLGSVILYYSELSHFATILDHFMILSSILEILPAIFHSYSAQSFLFATVHEAA
jgi:hypothetical protein